MRKFSGWTAAILFTTALTVPVVASAQDKKDQHGPPARAAAPVARPAAPTPHPVVRPAPAPVHAASPQPAVRTAPPRPVVRAAPPHPVVRAAPPHPVARVAPSHNALRRAATPHIAQQRAAVPNHAQHAAQRITPERRLRQNVQQPSSAAQLRAQRRADHATRLREQHVLRALPPRQRAAKREEFRQQRAQQRLKAQPTAQSNIQTHSNAAVQSNGQIRRTARRNGATPISVQAARQGRFASRFVARPLTQQALASNASADPIAVRRAWRRHHLAAFVPWYGPVFWPYAYADVFDYTFWPEGYDEGYWDYAYDDFFDGLFWGEQGPPAEYVYPAEYAYKVPAAARVSYASVEALCKQPGSGITAWPFAEIERKVGLNPEQKTLLNELRSAASKAAEMFKASCPSQNTYPLTPPGRLQAMTARLDATLQAVETVRPALEAFYNSLSDEQKERFNELGPNVAKNKVAAAHAETTGTSPHETGSCKRPKPGLANLPIEKIEDVVNPTDAQEAELKTLQDATKQAVGIMQEACPDETPLTPTGRLAAMQTRLQAMVDAANTVKPALERFYASLSSEQKARFNRIGKELAESGEKFGR